MSKYRPRLLLRAGLLAGACLLAATRLAWADVAASVGAAAGQSPGAGCEAAGAAAEARYNVPGGLLRAIGRVESGRRDPSGRVSAWPWTINAEGRGHLFESREDAQAAARVLQQSGVASIDVGCFQVNLAYHPDAFPALEDGFDPAVNADYAARFLVLLRGRTGSWEAAVAAYHSATPERGEPYRDRVLAGWSRDGTEPPPAPMLTPTPAVFVMRVETWTPPHGPTPGGMRIWTPSAAGQGATVIRIAR